MTRSSRPATGSGSRVNNVERRWRQIRQDTGLDWVTPPTFRKTVATLISERVSSEAASQQLGHSSPAITREFYISKPAIAADVAHVLQELSDPSGTEDDANTSGIGPSGSSNKTGPDRRFRRSTPGFLSG